MKDHPHKSYDKDHPSRKKEHPRKPSTRISFGVLKLKFSFNIRGFKN
jgi:hypothetical protein